MDPDSEPPEPVRHSTLAWHSQLDAEPFTHPAVFYRTTCEYLNYTVPFLLDGLTGQEPAAVAVPGPNLRALREELAARGGDVDRVRWLDMTEVGRNPGRIIPTVLRAFADEHAGRRVRIIGEPIWAERGPAEYPAGVQHEALINAAFHGRAATILCPYDAARLDPVALADAAATHPVLVDEEQWWISPNYAPDQVISAYNRPLVEPVDSHECPVETVELGRVRRWAMRLAGDFGLVADQMADVAFVVSELVTNAIEHGRGHARLRGWFTDTALVFQTSNAGRLTNPLAGRLPVAPRQRRGRGLLAVNVLTDLVRIYTSRHRTAVRAYFHRPEPSPIG